MAMFFPASLRSYLSLAFRWQRANGAEASSGSVG